MPRLDAARTSVRVHGRDGRRGSYLATEGSGERTDHAERCKLRTRTHRVSWRRTHADVCSWKACRPGHPRAARLVSSRGWRPGADGRQRGATESHTCRGRSHTPHIHGPARLTLEADYLLLPHVHAGLAEVRPESKKERGKHAKKNQTPRGAAAAGANNDRHRAHRQRTVHRSQVASAAERLPRTVVLAPVFSEKNMAGLFSFARSFFRSLSTRTCSGNIFISP